MKETNKVRKSNETMESTDKYLPIEEIRWDKAILYNAWGIEVEYPDYLDIDEIGILLTGEMKIQQDRLTSSLF